MIYVCTYDVILIEYCLYDKIVNVQFYLRYSWWRFSNMFPTYPCLSNFCFFIVSLKWPVITPLKCFSLWRGKMCLAHNYPFSENRICTCVNVISSGVGPAETGQNNRNDGRKDLQSSVFSTVPCSNRYTIRVMIVNKITIVST